MASSSNQPAVTLDQLLAIIGAGVVERWLLEQLIAELQERAVEHAQTHCNSEAAVDGC